MISSRSGPRLEPPAGLVGPLATPDPGAILYEHMFVESSDQLPDRSSDRSPDRLAERQQDRHRARESLALLAERTRPVSSSQTRLLPVVPPLAGLFPEGSLRRGSTIVVTGQDRTGTPEGSGSFSMALALLAAASTGGSWGAVVGLPGLGAVAAHDMGIDLSRLAVIPRPGAPWAEVTAAVIDGVDLVVLAPPFPPRPAMARRLVARARERRSILVVVPGRSGWPEHPDVHLQIGDMRWEGAGAGEGYLCERRMTVTATGRRSSARPRRRHLWLPSATGAVADAGDTGAAGEGRVVSA
jgi:hypothetical protein